MASFILWWFIIPHSGFLHSADAAVGMTDVSGLAVTNVNVPRFRPCGPVGGRLPPLQWGYHPIYGITPLPLPMGEVAERSSDGEGSMLMILMDVLIQNKRCKALSVSATPSQLSQRESQGRLFDSTRKDGTVTDNTRKRPPVCHSDRSVSGAEESTTWQKVLTQGKICNLSGFLDSLRFARNDMPGGVLVVRRGCNGNVTERHTGRSLHTLTGRYI